MPDLGTCPGCGASVEACVMQFEECCSECQCSCGAHKHLVRTNTIYVDAGHAYGLCEGCGEALAITDQTPMAWPR